MVLKHYTIHVYNQRSLRLTRIKSYLLLSLLLPGYSSLLQIIPPLLKWYVVFASTILIAHILWMVWRLHILTTLATPDYRGGPDILPFWSPLLLKLLFSFLVLLCRVWNIWHQQSSAFCSCDELEAHDRIARRCRARKNRCHSWYWCFWSLLWSALEFGQTNFRGWIMKREGVCASCWQDVGLGKASGA